MYAIRSIPALLARWAPAALAVFVLCAPADAPAVAGPASGAGSASAGLAADSVTRVVTVSPGDDVNAAITRAEPGDTVLLSAGSYPGPLLVDNAVTLDSGDATVTALDGLPAVEVGAVGATLESLTVTCDSAVDSTGIRVTADRVSVIDTSVLQCAHGVELNGATDAYLQGDDVLGSRGDGSGVGVVADDADRLTVFDDTFEDDDTGVVVRHTSAPAFDSNTFSRIGTAVALLAVDDAVVSETRVGGAEKDAVLISGADGAEITGFDGDGSDAAVQLSAADGPSSVVSLENANLARFAVGLQVDAHSIDDAVTVLGSRFDGVTRAGIAVAAGSGGTVDAAIDDFFGGCGPEAPAHSYDGGGVLVDDPSLAVSFLRHNCTPPAAAGSAGGASSSASVAGASSGGAVDEGDSDNGVPWKAIGSVLVTGGVALLLAGCAVGVLYAMRRGRSPR
ncbi:hypothetical protein [Humibacter ginsenosidimutans]|uniref:Right handed beta helix domain-containing protein n=1 Tax=Humibacter ginsenosidimutans TaxID=2599293 RepID=A0A5B8M3C4_9MICO|nr:hypothetical protein [Humibacter ginsenosidimutans]QDZ14285.1 hypothetical protein FPZ11_05445 [Humibacter ginsenosidimutans]